MYHINNQCNKDLHHREEVLSLSLHLASIFLHSFDSGLILLLRSF